jgi:hypothetical protein
MVHDARVATQWCGKHSSTAVNQHAIIEEAVFSVEAAPRLYNEDFMQLVGELRIELSSGVDSCSRELRESAAEDG